jgi:hypothetical protein
MDEMTFLGALVLLVIAGLLLVRMIARKQTGRKPDHPVYSESSRRKPHHHPAHHSMVHSHSAERMQAGTDIWRTSRLKANESRWETGVVVANKILSDSELALEERNPEEGHGMEPIRYKPTGTGPTGTGQGSRSGSATSKPRKR